jgi:hypothetical protein
VRVGVVAPDFTGCGELLNAVVLSIDSGGAARDEQKLEEEHANPSMSS